MFYKHADTNNDLRRILGGSWRLSAWMTAGTAGGNSGANDPLN
jgi:hypothetical protein